MKRDELTITKIGYLDKGLALRRAVFWDPNEDSDHSEEFLGTAIRRRAAEVWKNPAQKVEVTITIRRIE